MAEQFGGAIFALEHRFYGKSRPFDDLSTEHLKYLSSEQALHDLALFIASLDKISSVSHNSLSKVIVVGGSYPGNLSAWFRLQFPHLAFGSWASSAPVHAKSDYFEYDQIVGKQLGTKCGTPIQIVNRFLEQLFIDQDDDIIAQYKNMFHPLMSKQVPDNTAFMYILADIVAYAIQYDNP